MFIIENQTKAKKKKTKKKNGYIKIYCIEKKQKRKKINEVEALKESVNKKMKKMKDTWKTEKNKYE